MRAGAVALMIGAALPALAAPLDVQTLRYLCDRGVEVPATFVTGPEDGLVVMQIEGGQITLFQEPSASGAKYSWPSGGASYVLWSKGEEARIFWREDGQEEPLLTCSLQM
jgi:membrane-bound inhibitor of C-type lysozyme